MNLILHSSDLCCNKSERNNPFLSTFLHLLSVWSVKKTFAEMSQKRYMWSCGLSWRSYIFAYNFFKLISKMMQLPQIKSRQNDRFLLDWFLEELYNLKYDQAKKYFRLHFCSRTLFVNTNQKVTIIALMGPHVVEVEVFIYR